MSRPVTLRVSEIFYSVQGETSRIGLPTVFVRLTGCPLRCGYCDSEYAFYGGDSRTIAEILESVATWNTPWVTVTGGEPLAQKRCHELLRALCDAGYSVSLETSGALPIDQVDSRVSRIVDIKTPGSGELDRMRWDNLDQLRATDELKLVLVDEADYVWARELVHDRRLTERCPVVFSPVWETLPPRQLADWILRDRLNVRMQVQLHKVLWGEGPGR